MKTNSTANKIPMNAKPKDFFSDLFSFFNFESKTIDKEKKVLVLDIDETLVHSSSENPSKGFDFNVSTVVSGAISKLYVKKRPGLDDFLKEMNIYYDIYTYTSSMKEYSDQIIENIDPTGSLIKRSLCRHNCVYANGVYIKDLSKLKKKLKDVIIIDNSKTAFLLHKPNGILITAFYDDPTDRELKKLTHFLRFLSNIYDIRPVEDWRKSFNGSYKVEYLDFKKEKQVYINECSPKSQKEENNILCSFASQKKEVEKNPMEEPDDGNPMDGLSQSGGEKNGAMSTENFRMERSLSNLSTSVKSEKKTEMTNKFMKVKKDFHDKKSKILKGDQKPMMIMHDC